MLKLCQLEANKLVKLLTDCSRFDVRADSTFVVN